MGGEERQLLTMCMQLLADASDTLKQQRNLTVAVLQELRKQGKAVETRQLKLPDTSKVRPSGIRVQAPLVVDGIRNCPNMHSETDGWATINCGVTGDRCVATLPSPRCGKYIMTELAFLCPMYPFKRAAGE